MSFGQHVTGRYLAARIEEVNVRGKATSDAQAHGVPQRGRPGRLGSPFDRRIGCQRRQANQLEVVDEVHQHTTLGFQLEAERATDGEIVLGGDSDCAHHRTTGQGLASATTDAGSGMA